MNSDTRHARLSVFSGVFCFASTPVLVAWLPTSIPFWGILYLHAGGNHHNAAGGV